MTEAARLETVEGGAILLARKFFEGWAWQMTPGQKVVFLWLLYRARWKDGSAPWFDGQNVIELGRGQLVISQGNVAKACGVSRIVVRRTLDVLTEQGVIRAQVRASRYTVITILKYDTYQDPENYRARPRANRQPAPQFQLSLNTWFSILSHLIADPTTPLDLTTLSHRTLLYHAIVLVSLGINLGLIAVIVRLAEKSLRGGVRQQGSRPIDPS